MNANENDIDLLAAEAYGDLLDYEMADTFDPECIALVKEIYTFAAEMDSD